MVASSSGASTVGVERRRAAVGIVSAGASSLMVGTVRVGRERRTGGRNSPLPDMERPRKRKVNGGPFVLG